MSGRDIAFGARGGTPEWRVDPRVSRDFFLCTRGQALPRSRGRDVGWYGTYIDQVELVVHKVEYKKGTVR